MRPALSALLPKLIGTENLATTLGLYSSTGQIASLLGSSLAGIVIAVWGGEWAIGLDAVSFLVAAICMSMIRIPVQVVDLVEKKHEPFLQELKDGWRIITNRPVMQALVWLLVLINVASFLGPLTPALVSQQLHSGAITFGTLEVASVIGGIIGGLLSGLLEQRVGAGKLMIAGWTIAGLCTLGMAFSTLSLFTAILEVIMTFSMTAGNIAMDALTTLLVSDNYRGRVRGIMQTFAVITIPASSLFAGWLVDRVGVGPLFVAGSIWIISTALFAWSNHHVRTARI